MQKFRKTAWIVTGISALALVVFFLLYRQWLQLPIFKELSQTETFEVMLVFLTLTFCALVTAIVVSSIRPPSVEAEDAALNRLVESWRGVNYIDCDKLIGPDVAKASDALRMTAMYWRNGFLSKKLIFDQHGSEFIELFDQIDQCPKQVPGYSKPVKFCKDFLSNIVRSTYKEIKKYASTHQ